jgi:hypothetical protein
MVISHLYFTGVAELQEDIQELCTANIPRMAMNCDFAESRRLFQNLQDLKIIDDPGMHLSAHYDDRGSQHRTTMAHYEDTP